MRARDTVVKSPPELLWDLNEHPGRTVEVIRHEETPFDWRNRLIVQAFGDVARPALAIRFRQSKTLKSWDTIERSLDTSSRRGSMTSGNDERPMRTTRLVRTAWWSACGSRQDRRSWKSSISPSKERASQSRRGLLSGRMLTPPASSPLGRSSRGAAGPCRMIPAALTHDGPGRY